jgi:hypothetical protein
MNNNRRWKLMSTIARHNTINGTSPTHPSPESHLSSVVTVANLSSFMHNLGAIIDVSADQTAEQVDKVLRGAVEVLFGPEEEQIGLVAAESQAKVEALDVIIRGLAEQLRSIPKSIAGVDSGSRLPNGFARLVFLACAAGACVVTIGDGLNAAYLAARELQSMLAGLAFLLPALCAPVVAKAAVSRLPSRARFWAECALGLFGLVTAGFFFFQFVVVFASPRTLDELAAGGMPGMKWLYLAVLTLGFNVVYVLLSTAMGMLRPGSTVEQENPEHTRITQQIANLNRDRLAAQARVASQPVRRKKISDLKQFTLDFSKAACEAKRKAVLAVTEAAEARTKAHAEAALNTWDSFRHILANGSGSPLNGTTKLPGPRTFPALAELPHTISPEDFASRASTGSF